MDSAPLKTVDGRFFESSILVNQPGLIVLPDSHRGIFLGHLFKQGLGEDGHVGKLIQIAHLQATDTKVKYGSLC